MIKGIIFDMDGVLIDSEPIHYKAWSHAFKTQGIDVTPELYEEKIQAQGYKRAIKNLLPDSDDTLRDTISDVKMTHLKETIAKEGLSLFEDADWVVETLYASNVPMVIASSNRIADYFIGHTNKKACFQKIITGYDIKHNKPNPEIFQLAQECIGFKKQEVLVIEDSIVGIIAARRAGMNVLAIDRHQAFKEKDLRGLEKEISRLGIELTAKDHDNLQKTTTYVMDSLKEILPFILLL